MSRGFDARGAGVDLVAAIATVREGLAPLCDTTVEDAFATIETFCAVALRLMAKTNPSKVRAAAVAVEIQSLIQPGELRA